MANGYFGEDTNPEFVQEKDSLKSLILIENRKNDPAVQDSIRLAEEERLRIKKETDLQELIASGQEAKSKEDQAKFDAKNSRYSAKNQVELDANARSAIQGLFKIKSESTIDDTEQRYFDTMNLNITEDGDYVLDNYETFSFDDPEWVALYNQVVPQGADRINPFWAPDPDVYQEFLDHDKYTREKYATEQKDMSDMYNKLFKKDGTYTKEYKKLVDARDLSIKSIKAHDRIMNDEDDLDLHKIITEVQGDDLSASLDAIDDLHTSKNRNALVLDLQKTEYSARRSRRPIKLRKDPFGTYVAESYDPVDMQYAEKIDPRLFYTTNGIMNKGLVDKSWTEDYGIMNEDIKKSMELLMNPGDTSNIAPESVIPNFPSSIEPSAYHDLGTNISAQHSYFLKEQSNTSPEEQQKLEAYLKENDPLLWELMYLDDEEFRQSKLVGV